MSFPKIVEYTPPKRVLASLASTSVRALKVYRFGGCSIMLGHENVAHRDDPVDLRWHLSISHPKRDPTWEEIKHAQNELLPNVFCCMPMPPREYWLSIHDHCYHLWELRDQIIDLWKFEGEEARSMPPGTRIERFRQGG